MTIVLDDTQLVKLLERESAAAGQSVESFVLKAVQEKLAQSIPPEPKPRKPIDWDAVKRIQDKIAAAPVRDARPADELLGYNEFGLFDE